MESARGTLATYDVPSFIPLIPSVASLLPASSTRGEGGRGEATRCVNVIGAGGRDSGRARFCRAFFHARKKFAESSSISDKLVRRLDEAPMGRARTRRQTMRVMVFAMAGEGGDNNMSPTPEMLEAFA